LRTTPAQARAYYEAAILASFNPAELEKQAVYSDLGFLLLGWILEKISAQPLERLFEARVAAGLGLQSLRYLPLGRAPIPLDTIPTEDCPWRKHVLRGEVHDDNCYVLGGVAGHAGIFGTVADTHALGRRWLGALNGTDSWLGQATAARFWERSKVAGSTRALGWDGVSPSGSSSGKYFGPSSRGHLGFTGTSIWIDPEKDLVVTLLTNRVHPTRSNEKIKGFRPLFHDTLLTELGLG
ncbi:MAG: serine hydrolase, partial [Deltaproteobacteria bacterium]|nr:serine hydrolase [Deltaproteobacteria bacterium]